MVSTAASGLSVVGLCRHWAIGDDVGTGVEMTTFTPGPWRIVYGDGSPWEIVPECGKSVECNCAECADGARKGYGGRVYHNILETDSHVYGPTLQDAHLIAAAPELHEVLKVMAAFAGVTLEDDAIKNIYNPDYLRIWRAEYDKAKAALAKAEGRQS